MSVPLLGWDAPRDLWLTARRAGLGASDVAAALGFSPWETPWEVWAAKTGRLVMPDAPSAAMQLGTDLEPWLLDQAPTLIGMQVDRTPHMLYAHSEGSWKVCSPDAFAADGGLVEAKTAALLAHGWARLDEWHDGGLPLNYEFQCRWQMHVMDRPRVHLVALVAGLGLVHRVVERDLVVEASMVEQATTWWVEHVLGGLEPAVGRADLDALHGAYSNPDAAAVVDLDGTEALEWCVGYRQAHDAITPLQAQKDDYAARLKAALGNSTVGKLDGRLLVTWNGTKGRVDWEAWAEKARAVAEENGFELPDPETFRNGGRTLSVKKIV